ncbi:LPS export ABC transporter permease LptF [Ramlibacter sp. AW1]|uniref:Lipopolysaccharide export system permease protein LptF n=1 Tax=Ramlibacter aurantiacus TaxID=2801330 RepID=A0A936ZRD0_9BURK|nr:LPS export ABC transporter permease LptF [Ramlibacter aurantiacus]MBL0422073.1 LPS export ABC transporter permease LptF [Ramlibacter aurantiacus]
MLFHSSVRKELARSFGATLVVLITIVMTMTLIRTLSQASRGSVNPQEILMVMGYTVLGYLAPLLTLSLFVAIVGVLSRMWRDSEMVIWFSAGRGLSSLLRPLFAFAWPVLTVVALLALVAWPWANDQALELRQRYGSRGDLDRVAPGQFQESASGTRVFFMDKDTPDNRTGKNVFIATQDNGRETITSARTGQVVTEGDSRFLLLGDGQRMERTLKSNEVRVSVFEEFGARVGEAAGAARNEVPVRARSSLDLVREPSARNQAELAWRVGLFLAAFNFVLIAITVSSVNPRAGRSGNLLFALFAFIVYYNMLNLGQSWISRGHFGAAPYLLGLHGGVLALVVLWLGKQHNNWSLKAVRRRRAARA